MTDASALWRRNASAPLNPNAATRPVAIAAAHCVTDYRYDALDRLTSASSGSGALQHQEGYGYDGDGALVTQTVGTTTTAYAQDLAADASQVLVAQTQGVSATDYLYGQDRLAAQVSGASVHTWYLTDLQGSVRYTAYDDGTPTAQVSMYDPFGNQEDGVTPPRFGYDGELQDPATGLVNLRARWYQPQTGQFLQRDPLEDQTAQPYAYAQDDPVNNSDPSGQCYIGPFTVPEGGTGTCDRRSQADLIGGILAADAFGALTAYIPSAADKQCLLMQVLRSFPALRPALAEHRVNVYPARYEDGYAAGAVVLGEPASGNPRAVAAELDREGAQRGGGNLIRGALSLFGKHLLGASVADRATVLFAVVALLLPYVIPLQPSTGAGSSASPSNRGSLQIQGADITGMPGAVGNTLSWSWARNGAVSAREGRQQLARLWRMLNKDQQHRRDKAY